MKKRWYLICFLFCIYLLINIPGNADTKDSRRSIKVDHGLHEFTLIFKKNSVVTDVYVTNPDGTKYSLAREDNGILATPNYEIIQMKEPLPGEWFLSGPEQQIEQILILKEVGVGTNITTGVYFNGELLSLTGYLQQENKPITSDMAVDAMKMNFELRNKNNTFSYVIPYNKDGLFNNNLILNVPSAIYTAVWSAESTYLSKEHKLMIAVQKVPFEQAINTEHELLMIKLLKSDLIKAASVEIKILYKNVPQNLGITKNDLIWAINLASLCQQPSFSKDDVLIEIAAQTTSERDLRFRLLPNETLCK